jgi:hypothetical protein
MKRFLIATLVILLPLCSLVVWAAVRASHKNDAAAEKLQWLCIGAKDAMRQDAMAFEGSDDTAREAAYQRFYEGQTMYHSAQSLQYCLDTLPEMPLGCQLNKDWACLAKLAWAIHRSLP